MIPLFIDNFDSFTFNIIHELYKFSKKVLIIQNNENLFLSVEQQKPTHLILGPGPGNPKQLPQISSLITRYAGIIPILGICLGHQCIAHAFGGTIARAKQPIHGKDDRITHRNTSIFQDLPHPLLVGRYHSLIVESPLPECLEVLAETTSNEVMGLKHKTLDIFGVQFHPESVLTPHGSHIIKNFLTMKL